MKIRCPFEEEGPQFPPFRKGGGRGDLNLDCQLKRRNKICVQ